MMYIISLAFSVIACGLLVFYQFRRREFNKRPGFLIISITFVFLAVFFLIAFAGFNTEAVSMNRHNNAGGLIGFILANSTYSFFGSIAYFFPVLLLYASSGFAFKRDRFYFPSLFSIVLIFIIPLVIPVFGMSRSISGYYGFHVHRFLATYLGNAGIFLIALFILAASAIIFTGLLDIILLLYRIIMDSIFGKEETEEEEKPKKKQRKKKQPKVEELEPEEFTGASPAPAEPKEVRISTAFDKHIDYSTIIDDQFKKTFLEQLEDPPQTKISADEDVIKENIRVLEEKLNSFSVEGTVTNVNVGPVITTYEYEPSPGIKVNKITSLTDDLALAMKAKSIRILGHIPGKSAVGIEIPNKKRVLVYLKNLLTDKGFLEDNNPTAVVIGGDTENVPVFESISNMPHLLIAGTTGSGKSVCINAIITSILFKAQPEQVRFLMVDPKRIELSTYNGIPHLERPVITDSQEAISMLKELTQWMDIRYGEFAKLGVRSIEEYNKKSSKPKPYIIVIIDEMADLMMTSSKDIEIYVTRLAQMSRAVGIHLILATQRPSVNIITGSIKANFPVRISFKVPSKADSKTILDTVGAEKLLGKGDMLFIAPQKGILNRVHGAYIKTEEATSVANLWARIYMKKLFEDIVAEPEKLAELIIENDLIQCIANPHNTPAAADRIEQFTKTYAEELNIEPAELRSILYNTKYHIPIEESGITQNFAKEINDEYAKQTDIDPLFEAAKDYVIMKNQASTSMLQRHFGIGYPRAARIVEQLEQAGIVGPQNGSRPREIILDE